MHKLGGRKIFLFGFIAVLLIGIPVTIYLVQQQQETRTRAEKSTTVSFTPESSATAPIKKNVGDSIPLDIYVDPGTNLVGFVKFELQYDPEKLATASANAFVVNEAVFPTILEGPQYSPGKILISVSVGPNPTQAIQTKTKVATVTFTALSNTPPGTPTLVTYGAGTDIRSIGENDQAAENVLSSATPAAIEIGGTAITPTEPIPTVEPTPTDIPTATPTIALTITPGPTSTPSSNQSPVCSALTVDKSPSGAAPLALTFGATGNDPDGTVSKVTFNFGDGQVIDVTDPAMGVGTASVSASTTYTYNNAGTFSATAVLTDSSGGVSTSGSCTQTVTVTANGTTEAPTAAPTLPPTGMSGTAIGIGALIMAFIIGGGFLFFLL